ncbi:Leucine-rich repeat [Trinorchestia longiramus]|nr:Leucine-rich repeat [Trinorchestia longiramus]
MARTTRGAVVAVIMQLAVLHFDQSATCPAVCRCSVDHHGRSTVTCQQGDMRDVIPIFDMADNTKVLIVTAPPLNENYLSLGPIFQGLRRLEEIQITWSNIPNLGEHSFWGLHRLEILNLTWNHLTSLRDTNFKGAKSLKRLDLSHNRIESVPSAAFRHIRQLRYLGLAHNSIPELVPRIFFGLTHLEYLDLSHNPIQRLDADIFTDISLLKTLKCSACALTTFSRTLLSMISDVRVLDLSNNKLTHVPDLTHAVPYLVSLQLDGNLIAMLDKLTLVNSRLTHLHLAHNRIVRVEPDSFVNSSLSHLDLMYNRLTRLDPDGIKTVLGKLKVLKISGNSINVLELKKILLESQRLHELGLGDVGLASLPPDLLTHNSNLRHLNLSANYLTSLPMELFITCPNLQVLDLSSNSYKGLNAEILEGLSDAAHLRVLRLEGNPWICDQCHVSPLLHWLHGAPDQESGCLEPKVWTCLKCLGPPRFAGLELALLPPGDLPACSYTPTLAAPSFIQEPTQVNNLSMAVQAEFPRGELTRQNTANIDRSDHDLVELDPPWTIADLVKDRFYTIVIASCVFLVCLLFLVLIAIYAYHRQTAFYYTNEHEMSSRGDSLDQQPKIVKNNNNKSPRKLQKKASIAAIEEVRDIAGSTELKDGVVSSALDRNSSSSVDVNSSHVGAAEEKVTVSQSTKDTYQTVVDELGRTKLCKSSNKVPLIQILDSEPRPGKG